MWIVECRVLKARHELLIDFLAGLLSTSQTHVLNDHDDCNVDYYGLPVHVSKCQESDTCNWS